jgi:hypothetical protein
MVLFTGIFMTIYEILYFILHDPIRAFLDISGHYITGLILANIIYKEKPIQFRFIIAFAGFLPDFDFIFQILGLIKHGEILHSPIILIPVIIFGLFFYKKPIQNKNFGKYLIFTTLCVILHLIFDLSYNYILQITYIIVIGSNYFIWNKIINLNF